MNLAHINLDYFHEKIAFAVFSMTSSGLLWIGSIMTTGEARWLYITAAASIMMSGSLSLAFRRPDESIRMVVGRAGIAMLGGIFGTRLAVHNFSLGDLAADGINLAGIACIVCAVTFFSGLRALNLLAKRSGAIVDRVINAALPPGNDDDDDDDGQDKPRRRKQP